jgi:D-alanyl-D-alanine carboxypeptidase/D-alanyl-D-alanine-endopeptidase (penicillin-binding protein 4)
MQENKNSRIIAKKNKTPDSPPRGAAFRVCLSCALAVLAFLSPAAADTLAAAPKAPPSAIDGNPNRLLEAMILKSKFPLSKTFVAVRDLTTDSMIAERNADEAVNPASVCKLLTAAIAFDKLGTAYAFKTSVYCDGGLDPSTGTCKGNLYIRGGGDPSLVIERLWLFVQHLSCMGIKSIERDIVLDDSFLDSVAVGPGFIEDSSDNPYMAPVNALSANFNCVSVWARPGAAAGSPVFSTLLPRAKIVTLANTAKTATTGKISDCAIVSRNAGESTSVSVSGTLPLDGKQVLEYRKVWQSRDYFASILQNLLVENKIAFKGGFRHGLVPDSLRQKTPFYVFGSIPLYDIVTDMFKYSSNFAAEMIFKTLSAEKDSTFGSWEKSASLASAWWKEKGLAGSPKIRNGSGMGDINRMSCRQIVDLLTFVNKSKAYLPEYLSALPSAGVDGTLKSRFRTSRFKGIVRGKTGTLNDYGVHSIAGYALLPKKTYAFAIIFNGVSNRSAGHQWEMQEKILDLVVPER